MVELYLQLDKDNLKILEILKNNNWKSTIKNNNLIFYKDIKYIKARKELIDLEIDLQEISLFE